MSDRVPPKPRAAWPVCARCGLSSPDVRGEPAVCPEMKRCEEVKKLEAKQAFWDPNRKAKR